MSGIANAPISQYELGDMDWAFAHFKDLAKELQSPLPLVDIAEATFDSEYMEHMATKQPLRFSEFRYERAQKIADLRIDVLPHGHMLAAAIYGARIALSEREAGRQLPPFTAAVTIAALLGHDVGESLHEHMPYKVGDIPYGRKTLEQRRQEAINRQQFYDEILTEHLSARQIQFMEAIIRHRVSGRAGKLFEAAHDTGALETATLASKAMQEHLILAADLLPGQSMGNIKSLQEAMINTHLTARLIALVGIKNDVEGNLLATYGYEHAANFSYCEGYFTNRFEPGRHLGTLATLVA